MKAKLMMWSVLNTKEKMPNFQQSPEVKLSVVDVEVKQFLNHLYQERFSPLHLGDRILSEKVNRTCWYQINRQKLVKSSRKQEFLEVVMNNYHLSTIEALVTLNWLFLVIIHFSPQNPVNRLSTRKQGLQRWASATIETRTKTTQ